MNQQWQLAPEETWQSTQVWGSSKKPQNYQEKFFSAFLSMNSKQSVKPHEVQQLVSRQANATHTVSFIVCCVISIPKHAPFPDSFQIKQTKNKNKTKHMSASAKHPLRRVSRKTLHNTSESPKKCWDSIFWIRNLWWGWELYLLWYKDKILRSCCYIQMFSL